MSDLALAALFVLAVWWASTGLVLKLVWLERRTFRYSVVALGVLALAALGGLLWSRGLETTTSAYVAFGCALAVWAFHELTFLLGIVTGPRKLPCPPDARGWRRFVLATEVVIHHEVALAGTLAAIVALTWDQPNQVGTGTFLVLWVMRLSAKLNVFLGVRNLTEQFVPDHLRYMLGYFRRARMNALMPVSIVAGSVVVLRLAAGSVAEGATPFAVVGRTLLATLLGLAVLEHLFLAIPLPDALLWRWAIRTKRMEAQ